VHGLFVSCECLVIISGVVNLQTLNEYVLVLQRNSLIYVGAY
jgi:hypothetical protein